MACPAAQSALADGTRCSYGPFELHGVDQLRDWAMQCLNRMDETERKCLLDYVSCMSFSLGTVCSGTDCPSIVMRVVLQAIMRATGEEDFKKVVRKQYIHVFSCEKKAWKRRFIRSMFAGSKKDLQALFSDAADIASGQELFDDISGGMVPGPRPSQVTDMAVGFPCQDVSRLNVNRGDNLFVVRNGGKRTGMVYVSLMKFLDSEDSQPLDVASFHGGMQGLLLENVLGLLEAPKGIDPSTKEPFYSNLDFCTNMLRERGWFSVNFTLDALFFGFPVHRARVWIVAIPPHVFQALRMQPEEVERMLFDLMQRFFMQAKTEMRDLDDFLVDDNHPVVLKSLQATAKGRRTEQQQSSRKRKWPEIHAQIMDKRGKDIWSWTYPTEETKARFPGLQALTDREMDALGLFDTKFPDAQGTQDVGSSGNRQRILQGCSHIITPTQRVYLRHRCRMMTGFESMMLQGIHYGREMPETMVWASKELQDLAGNAFHAWCHGASLLVLLYTRSLAWQRLCHVDVEVDAPLLRPRPRLSSADSSDVESEVTLESLGQLNSQRSGDSLDDLLRPSDQK
jgi:site-specific DNA-cytosine methylase